MRTIILAMALTTAIPAHAQIVNPLYNACLNTMPNGMDGNPPPSEGVDAWVAQHHDSFEHPCLRELAQDRRNAAQLAIHPRPLDPANVFTFKRPLSRQEQIAAWEIANPGPGGPAFMPGLSMEEKMCVTADRLNKDAKDAHYDDGHVYDCHGSEDERTYLQHMIELEEAYAKDH